MEHLNYVPIKKQSADRKKHRRDPLKPIYVYNTNDYPVVVDLYVQEALPDSTSWNCVESTKIPKHDYVTMTKKIDGIRTNICRIDAKTTDNVLVFRSVFNFWSINNDNFPFSVVIYEQLNTRK